MFASQRHKKREAGSSQEDFVTLRPEKKIFLNTHKPPKISRRSLGSSKRIGLWVISRATSLVL